MPIGFRELIEKMRQQGITDPSALAAAVGRKWDGGEEARLKAIKKQNRRGKSLRRKGAR